MLFGFGEGLFAPVACEAEYMMDKGKADDKLRISRVKIKGVI